MTGNGSPVQDGFCVISGLPLPCSSWPTPIDFYGKVDQNRQVSRDKMQALRLRFTARAMKSTKVQTLGAI